MWEPYAVKVQTIKTAIEVRACCAACMHALIDARGAHAHRDRAHTKPFSGHHPPFLPPCALPPTAHNKQQAACMILRIDDIVSGMKKKK